MKATTAFILCLTLSFCVVTFVGCNSAPATSEKKADDAKAKPKAKPGKPRANTTG